MRREVPVQFSIRKGTADRWTTRNPVLAAGEPGLETDTGRMKIGNGIKPWSQLEYYLPESVIIAAITAALGSGSGGEAPPADLAAHISDPTPHPVYDDGPSFVLRYQNAKV